MSNIYQFHRTHLLLCATDRRRQIRVLLLFSVFSVFKLLGFFISFGLSFGFCVSCSLSVLSISGFSLSSCVSLSLGIFVSLSLGSFVSLDLSILVSFYLSFFGSSYLSFFVSFGAFFILCLICLLLGLVRTGDCRGSLFLSLNDLANAILVPDDEPRVFSRKDTYGG